MNPISAVNTQPALPTPAGLATTGTPGTSFKNLFLESIQHVSSMQQNADLAVEQLMTGGDVNPAEVLSAVQKADMTSRTILQITNKLIQAYQEIKDIRI